MDEVIDSDEAWLAECKNIAEKAINEKYEKKKFIRKGRIIEKKIKKLTPRQIYNKNKYQEKRKRRRWSRYRYRFR
jgi:hypothetical protein